MPTWLTEFMKLLGFSTPLIYAGATYFFFLWLDKKASGPAKKAISGWLVPKQYDRAAIAAAILELFYRVYTRPLWDIKALFRSALITVSITLVLILQQNYTIITDFWNPDLDADGRFYSYSFVLMAFSVNIAGDYIALFIVRARLADSRLTPFFALTVGPALGVLFISFCLFARAWVFHSVSYGGPGEWWEHEDSIVDIIKSILDVMTDSWLLGTSLGALVAHMWLPFFALCVGLVKGLSYFLLAAHTAQWFLKRGKDHPLEAVGLVAAPLMFIGAAAVQLMLR